MAAELQAGRLPGEFPPLLNQLLYKPDRNRPETKALEAACSETGLSVPRLLQRCGALPATHDYHLGRFLFEYFPHGTDFPEFTPPSEIGTLPVAEVRAFSIDDAQTTEIDDAFSVTPRSDGGMRVGIHIAAPGLGIRPDSDLGRMARGRLSTVYMPGRKITMLPDSVVGHFTLGAGNTVPAISLYLDVGADFTVTGHETRLERIPVVANLRHHDIEPVFNEQTLSDGLGEFPFRDELQRLWELATVLEAGRGKPSATPQQKDYSFSVDWDATGGDGPGRINEHLVIQEIDVLFGNAQNLVDGVLGRAPDILAAREKMDDAKRTAVGAADAGAGGGRAREQKPERPPAGRGYGHAARQWPLR